MGDFMIATGVVTATAACGVAVGRDLTAFIAALVTGAASATVREHNHMHRLHS